MFGKRCDANSKKQTNTKMTKRSSVWKLKPDEDNRETLAKEDEAGCVCLLFY